MTNTVPQETNAFSTYVLASHAMMTMYSVLLHQY